MQFIVRDPNTAYVDSMLWLPKNKIAYRAVQNALETWIVQDGQPVNISLWEESQHHLIVPREFLRAEDYKLYAFPFVDLTPKAYPKTNLGHRITLRTNLPNGKISKQPEAWSFFERQHNGILNLAPGKGKTTLSLLKIVKSCCPALIVVHNTYLMEQWKERIAEFVELPIGEKLGIIQGGEFDWRRSITLAMIHTLAARVQDGSLLPEFSSHFGQVYFDEVHHLAANFFSKTAPIIMGQRFGLTATPDRLDGLQFIYKYHLGGVFYSDMEMDLVPTIYFQETPTNIDLRIREVKDTTGQVNLSKLRSHLGTLDDVERFRYHCIKEAYDKPSRKLLILSHSKEQLKRMAERFPDSCLIIQETPQAERTSLVRKSRATFAIARLGVEGLDDENIDTIFFLTPFSSENDLKQALGRIQRLAKDKNDPIAIIFDDVLIPPLSHLCNKLRKTLKSWDMRYQTLAAPNFT